jgi:hypothetical protein
MTLIIYARHEDACEQNTATMVKIVCDNCGANIKPNHDIHNSGWTKHGCDNGPGTDKLEYHYCHDCSMTINYK